MGTMKTPGVYIVEKNAFPNSVVEVATAVPAFIGYTEKAVDGTTSLSNKPKRITSMGEFHNFFGGAPKLKFDITLKEESGESTSVKLSDDVEYEITEPSLYTLYYNMLLFFANGGGACYIVSVGNYDYDKGPEKDTLESGIAPLLKEQEPTMIVIPEAVNLKNIDCYELQQSMVSHCGDMKNRFAILDIWGGSDDSNLSQVEGFRAGIGSNYLAYSAAYFPWIETSVVSDSDISWENIDGWETWLQTKGNLARLSNGIELLVDTYQKAAEKTPENIFNLNNNLHSALLQNSSTYKTIVQTIKDRLNLLPPSAAIAGIYTMVDNTRGVWKAPANVSINSVIVPSVNITNEEQEDLNVPVDGKSINAIRYFVGNGIKVWGARTLDGNSLDWRYVNVRRTMIFLEESVKNAARAYVFEPNDANTWINVKSMIENFLRGIWKRGGLAGASPEDAYSVHVGLGETMTPEDVLEGILRVTVLVAISRPAEFIEITFQQQMQKS